MEPKLPPGTFYGERSRFRHFSGIGLTECLYSPAFKIPRHSHKTAYFGLVLQGSYTETYEAKTRDCGPSTLLFHPAGEVHSESHEDITVRILNIEFPSEWLNRLSGRASALHAPAAFPSGPLVRMATRLYHEFRNPDAFAPLTIEGLTLEIVAETARQHIHEDSYAPLWLQQVKDRLHDQYTDHLTLETIAALVGVHPAHLSRAFRQHYHCTLGDYVRDLRLEQARHALATSDTSLSEIALQTGYSDQSHFATAFKRHTGFTPAQFRKMTQKR